MPELLKGDISFQSNKMAINLASEPVAQPYDIDPDKDITYITKDLANHLTTLSTNLEDMKEVRAWMRRAEETLREILVRLEGSNELRCIYEAEVG